MIAAKKIYCNVCECEHIEGLHSASHFGYPESDRIRIIDNDITDYIGRLLIYEESFNNVPAGKLRQIAIKICEFIQNERDKKNEKTT